MASIENSLKYEAEVEPGKVRLITSGEFVRAHKHSTSLGRLWTTACGSSLTR